MKVLITGACGYIGSHIVPYLAKHASSQIEEIIIYDNLSLKDYGLLFGQEIKGLKVRLVKADILDRRSLLNALSGVDVVIHLAAVITQPYTDVQLHVFDQINNWGTASLA